MVSVDTQIVSFNTRDLLRTCLSSLMAHPPADASVELRVSVLDNGSADASADMVEAEFPSVRLIRSPVNLGSGLANNYLALTTEASHIMLLNPDTILKQDVAGPLLAALESDSSIAISAPKLVYPDGVEQASRERLPTLAFEFAREIHGTKLQPLLRPIFNVEDVLWRFRPETPGCQSRTRDAEFLWATCWLLRRSEFVGGLFDPRFPTYDDDLDLCRRLRCLGRRLVYVPEVEVVHLGGRSSTSDRKLQLTRAARARYYRKHEGLASELCYRAIVATVDLAKRGVARRARISGSLRAR